VDELFRGRHRVELSFEEEELEKEMKKMPESEDSDSP
jgi:hypothetical protein